jgi:hypothetical protein
MHTLVLSALLLLQTGEAQADEPPQAQPGVTTPAPKRKAAGVTTKNDTRPGEGQKAVRAQGVPANTQALQLPPWSTPVEVELQSQIVPDPDRPDAEKIVFNAQLGTPNFEDSEEGVTSMEDAVPATGKPFSNRTNIRYVVKEGTFTCDIPMFRDSTSDIPYSFVMTIEANKSKTHYILRAKGEIPHLQSRWEKLGLTGQILFASLAALLSTAFVMLIIWFVRGRNREPELTYRPAARSLQQQPPNQPIYREPVTNPYIASAAPSHFEQQSDIYRTVKDNSQKIADLEQSLSSLLGRPTDEWRNAIGNVGDLQAISCLVQPRAARHAGHSGLAPEEQAILAVVNQWISSGVTNREQMLTMATELGQEMKLMQHVNVTRLLGDVTALDAVDLAESITDGGWLYCTGQDGLGMVAPADTRLFPSAQDRTLLQRMFDGVNPGSGQVQFAQIYRPCRLRIKQAPNRYEIVQKGLLQLFGQPSPTAPPPPDYLSLRQPIQSRAIRPGSSPTLVSVVREQMESLANRLASMENILNGLSARSEVPITASRIADLDQFVLTNVQRQVQQIEQRLSQQVEQLLKLPAAAAPTAAGPSTTVVRVLGEQVTEIRKLIQELTMRIDKVETDRTRGARVRATLAPGKQSDEASVQEIVVRNEPTNVADTRVPSSAPGQVSLLTPRVAEGVSTIAEQSAGERRGLPAGWQEVVAGIEAFTGLAERDLAESLKRLQIALQKLPGGSGIRLLHLMETMGKFRVHDATVSPEGQVVCSSCDGPRTFQVAVCAGEDGASELQVLFAAGDYAPYNYPAGYRQLIQSMPNQQFQIQTVLAPAVLTLISGNPPAEYTVQYKLQWR